MSDEKYFTLPSIIHDPEATTQILLRFTGTEQCARFWQPFTWYDAGEWVRPTGLPTGFGYRCSTSGMSGASEPRWPTKVNEVKLDGSARWLTLVSKTEGFSQITGLPLATPSSPALKVQNIAVVNGTNIQVDYAEGDANVDYVVKFAFLMGGKLRIARQLVEVRQL